jgi:hypothetical protein
MTTAAHSQIKAARASEVHRVNDIDAAQAASNQRRSPVDHTVVHPACIVVPGITGPQEHARKTSGQFDNIFLIE